MKLFYLLDGTHTMLPSASISFVWDMKWHSLNRKGRTREFLCAAVPDSQAAGFLRLFRLLCISKQKTRSLVLQTPFFLSGAKLSCQSYPKPSSFAGKEFNSEKKTTEEKCSANINPEEQQTRFKIIPIILYVCNVHIYTNIQTGLQF